jgi:hypothetical protein
MANLLQQAIGRDDGDQAAKIIQDALAIESNDVANYSRNLVEQSRAAPSYHRQLAANGSLPSCIWRGLL